jgi:deoxyribodipyrimidine photo-lyase
MPNTVIFLFHRDLRIVDHRGLETAVEFANAHNAFILPLFIFTHDQIDKNPLMSSPSVQFMVDSLEDLDASIAESGGKLRFAHGATVDILRGISGVVGIVETRDYTPYAKQRENEIRELCEEKGIAYLGVEDIYLTTPGSVVNKSGKRFQKFTPFWDTAKHIPVSKPRPTPDHIPWLKTQVRIPHSVRLSDMRIKPRISSVQPGGRKEGLLRLSQIPREYETSHDMLAEPTSQLSAHNHFGTVSIREVYWSTSQDAFRRQLYWRDFYGHIMDGFETLYGVSPYEFQAPTGWRKGEKEVFEAWTSGTTGVPMIDAAMRQLLTTGFMHNRARMVVASWLVKDKGVHWRWGERWFAKHLVDYDAAQNMMNWIWIASVLPFASAPFRRHDPERYAARFDPTGEYIHTWSKEAR